MDMRKQAGFLRPLPTESGGARRAWRAPLLIMKRFLTPDGLLALCLICLSIAALGIWFPADIETGMIEKMRRQVRIGDAMLPTVALGFVIAGGLMTLFVQQPDAPSLSRSNLGFLAMLLGILAVSFAIMRWLGPWVVDVIGLDADYRALRDERPWKYIGFLTGGTGLVAALITLMSGRLTWIAVVVGLCAALVLIAVYDLPFEDLLLPPNGDV